LEEVGAEIFSELLSASGPLELPELGSRLLEHCTPDTTTAEVNAVLAELLPRLRQLGIAERCEPDS
jgi:hypothetical protein